MPLSKIQLKPGYNPSGTRYSAAGSWYLGNNVRFNVGLPESLGGWQYLDIGLSMQGIARSVYTWAAFNGAEYTAVGTDWKFYIVYEAAAYDITPVRRTAATGSVTIDTNSTNSVTITDTAHGAVVNDFVTISGVSAPEAATLGLVESEINAEHQIYEFVDANTYRFYVPTAATATASLSPASGSAEYQINTSPNASWAAAGGWGSGAWGSGGWGRSIAGSIQSFSLRLWSEEIDGENLVFSDMFGNIYYWNVSAHTTGGIPDSDGSQRALELSAYATLSGLTPSAVPIINGGIAIGSKGGHLISFASNHIGSSDLTPMLVRWSDNDLNSNSIYDWTPRATGTSGGQVLTGGSQIIGHYQTRSGILIWTDSALHLMRYVGPPSIYSFDILSNNASIVSPNAMAEVNNIVYFMAPNGFYAYSGTVTRLSPEMEDYVFDDINVNEAFRIFAAFDERYSEVTWYYCTANSKEIDRYVTFNYKDNAWTTGNLDMVSQGISSTITSSSVLNRTARNTGKIVNNDYFAYVKQIDESTVPPVEITSIADHDVGTSAFNERMSSYIETSEFEIASGDHLMFLDRVIPDITFPLGTAPAIAGDGVSITLDARKYPNSSIVTKSDEILSSTEKVDIRSRGRTISFKLSALTDAYKWSMGAFRFNARPDGRR